MKKYKIRHQHFTILDNKVGKVTLKLNILYLIAEFILEGYPELADAEVDISNIAEDKITIYIISPKSLKTFSRKKLEFIKRRVKTAFEENGFKIQDVVITSEESLRE
ncbi:MAG: hypothetical protein R6V14_01230 [Halanaerobiales bacterium]